MVARSLSMHIIIHNVMQLSKITLDHSIGASDVFQQYTICSCKYIDIHL